MNPGFDACWQPVLPPPVTRSDEEPIAAGGWRFAGSMAKRLQVARLVGLGMLLGAAFLGLAYRLFYLQVVQHDKYVAIARHNTRKQGLLEPRRGDILDARGTLLATSVLVKRVCADPSLIGNYQAEVAKTLAPLLGKGEKELFLLLSQAARRNEKGEITNQYVVLKKRVPVDTWLKVQAAMTNLVLFPETKKLTVAQQTICQNLSKGVFAQDEHVRDYPNHQLAAHVIGFARSVETEVDRKSISEIQGVDGIEATFNAKLNGFPGLRVTEADRQRRELVALRSQELQPQDGLDVVLTIDSVIQHILEVTLAEAMEKHSPISASGLVIRPRTGEILAMATLPNYDPSSLADSPPSALRNRVIADCVEPGSTFKVVVVSGALNDGTVKLSDQFDCEHRSFKFAGRTLHDHESYGVLSVTNIITKSSNIGAAKIGIKMGPARLYEYIRDFGFGARTGIPLPAEAYGIVHSLKNWSKVSIAQIPMGQGIAVTPLQMTMALCTIANKGWLMRPMLVDRLEDHDDHSVVVQYAPQRIRQVVSEAAAKNMTIALKTVVSPDGTAPKAALEHYEVAGKTGTAQKVENGAYAHGKYFSSFIGFFPADDPQLCIAIMLDEPDIHKGYYGGQTAAPLFKAVAEATATYLNIRPDDDLNGPPDSTTKSADTRTVKTASRLP
jgi:cell division protein FtsI/penicillin-binding protein 2